MPGTYPRSSNPFFPFDRLDRVERELRLFHDLTYSSCYQSWALSTVFSSRTSAEMVAYRLNSMLGPYAGGSYVIVPANKALVWCRVEPIGYLGRTTSEVVAWSAPVADSGWIIVWQPDNTMVMTESEYEARFNTLPYLKPMRQILWPSHHEYASLISEGKKPIDSSIESLSPLTTHYSPVLENSYYDRCPACGEPAAFCRCEA